MNYVRLPASRGPGSEPDDGLFHGEVLVFRGSDGNSNMMTWDTGMRALLLVVLCVPCTFPFMISMT